MACLLFSVSKFLTNAGGVFCLHDKHAVFPSISKPQKTGEGSGSQFGLSVKIKHTYSGNPQRDTR